MNYQAEAIQAIEAQQAKAKPRSPQWMVGEQLKDICRREPRSAELIARDLQVEAMSMGDNIVLMDKGVIMQRSSPKEMYHDPQNAYTAQFIGTPPMNILTQMVPGAWVGFRPEKVTRAPAEDAALTIPGRVITREQLGAEYQYSVDTAYGKLMVKTEEEAREHCLLRVRRRHLYVFDTDGSRAPLTPELLDRLAALPREEVQP